MQKSLFTLLAAFCSIAAALPGIDVEGRSPAVNCYIQAWSNTDCTGSAGPTYVVSSAAGGTCFTPDGTRHSYVLGAGCPTLTISQYGVANCAGSQPLLAHQGPGCHPFNNNYAVASFNAQYPS